MKRKNMIVLLVISAVVLMLMITAIVNYQEEQERIKAEDLFGMSINSKNILNEAGILFEAEEMRREYL